VRDRGDEAVVSILTHITPPRPQQQGQTAWTRLSADDGRSGASSGGAAGRRSTEEWAASSEDNDGLSSSDDGALETARELNDDDHHAQPWRVTPNRWTEAYSSHTTWDD
jgi:hypothetical protein